MHYQIGKAHPADFKEAWPGELGMFSHYDAVASPPQPLCLITTLKENGKPNACFHAGVLFSGDSDSYYAVLAGMGGNHTYENILRDNEFCINFLSSAYYAACGLTIEHNGDDDDEIAAGGFTAEPCETIKPPRIGEALVSFECKLISTHDISGKGGKDLFAGEVLLVHVDGDRHTAEGICGPGGFMYNINSLHNFDTGEREPYAAAYLTAFGIG